MAMPLMTADRPSTSLDGEWQAIVDPYEAGYYDMRLKPRSDGYFRDSKPQQRAELVEYDFDHAGTLTVPGDWNTQRDTLLFYEGSIWYRRRFDYALPANKRLFLRFGAANYLARVWLNGLDLGTHRGGFTPFDFEITDKLRPRDNVLVVQVDNRRESHGVPGLMTDWWNYGGLTRSVALIETPKTFISDYFLQLQVHRRNRVAGWVRIADCRPPQKINMDIPEAGIHQLIDTNRQCLARFAFTANLRLWSPEDPQRYRVRFSIDHDMVEERIGFRSIERVGRQLMLNGQPLFLRGIALHEEMPGRSGRASGPGDAERLVSWASELGANFLRLAHYPHDSAVIEEAERRGLMLWDEIPVYWELSWQQPETFVLAEQQLSEMVSRDKNRAAVIVWSVGNETPVMPARTAFLSKLVHSVRAQDPTRLISAALLYRNVRRSADEIENVIDDPLANDLDLISVNEYIGWYDGPPSAAGKTRWRFPANRPFLFSEFGADAKLGRHGTVDERWTEEYQANLYREQIAMFERLPGLSGVVPWVLSDFRSPRRPLPGIQDYFNRKGLISEQGAKKQAFFTLQTWYAKKAREPGVRGSPAIQMR